MVRKDHKRAQHRQTLVFPAWLICKAARVLGLGCCCCLLHFGSNEKWDFMVFFQVPAGTASVVSASEVLVN